jgi:hypothetical protein
MRELVTETRTFPSFPSARTVAPSAAGVSVGTVSGQDGAVGRGGAVAAEARGLVEVTGFGVVTEEDGLGEVSTFAGHPTPIDARSRAPADILRESISRR